MTADDIMELASLAGLGLDAGSHLFLASSAARRPDGTWARSRIPVPPGKEQAVCARELAGLFLSGETILHVTLNHHTARERFRYLAGLAARTPDLARHVTRITAALGSEEIRSDSGRIRFIAAGTARYAARGFSADLAVLENPSRQVMAAVLPCLASRPDPQAWLPAGTDFPAVPGREGRLVLVMEPVPGRPA